MKLGKIFGWVAMGAFACTLFTGCGETEGNDDSKAIKIGMITTLNASEKKMDEILKLVEQRSNVDLPQHTTTLYKNLTSMKMGLESGSVDEISTYKCVANYLEANDSKLTILESHGRNISDSFCFAIRKDSESLKNSLNGALEKLKKDGTLDKLIAQYVTNVEYKEPTAIEIPHFDGAETLKVAVTGDLPPLDLVLADGSPAGFNTALLAEIAKKLQRNIEIVNIDSDARAAALSSGRADIIFWAILPTDRNIPSDIDKPEGATLCTPYFTDKIMHLGLKK